MTDAITAVAIEGYRSIRRIHLPVERLTVLVGRNGVGKTNLYRALELLRAAAAGTITRDIAAEGGIGSVLWAGPRERGRKVRLALAVDLGHLRYRVEVGLPFPTEAALSETEPLVKVEELTLLPPATSRPVVLMKREGPGVWLRDEEGRRHSYERALVASETALAAFQDQKRFAELDMARRALLDWRFYHDFRTDRASPIRRPALAITTPTLASDGHDLAAALATVARIRGEAPAVDQAVDDAFPGARLALSLERGEVSLGLAMPDLPRPLSAHELSDGTLAYLALVAALAGYRLPGFVALNEPETSLHPDLIAPLARLIARAAERTQIWVVTHSEPLAAALAGEAGTVARQVVKQEGATWIEGLRLTGAFGDG